MAGKKTRNRNILSLDKMQIRGISSRAENYPSLERPDDIIPMHYLSSVNEAIDSYVTPSGSSMSTPSDDERQAFMFESNSGGLTSGNSTERSSVFSWADDEFDKQAGRTVQRMFQEIDDILFEGNKTAPTSVQLENECKEWNSRFPHLRILGQQLKEPCDLGYQLIPRPSQAKIEELVDVGDNEESGQDTQSLCIVGTRIHPIDTAAILRSSTDEVLKQQLAYLEEEIIESDGVIEEYFAYDYSRPWEDEGNEVKRYHAPRRKGFPPLTPNACVQNSIYSQAFDMMWAEVVSWMRDLLIRHWQFCQEEKKFSIQADAASSMSVLHPVLPSFDISFSPYPFGSNMGRGLLDGPSNKLAPMASGRLNTAPSLNISVADRQNLTGVMTISSKALHNRPTDRETRAPSVLGEELMPVHIGLHVNRPGSSTLSHINRSNRPASVRTTDNYNYRLTSARGRGRLRPIDRARTPNMEGIITGKKLPTASDRLGSPPHPMITASPSYMYHWGRNPTLPPIETVPEDPPKQETHSSENKTSNNASNKSSAKFRISSAAADDRGLRLKDRSATFISESRPNTTHTFGSDAAFGILNRRSSTPQSFSLFKSAAAPPPAAGNHGIMSGITGISIGIPGSSSHMEPSVSQYGNSQAGYFKVL